MTSVCLRRRLILPVLLLGVAACGDQGADPTAPSAPTAPELASLPEFTAGTSVTLAWSIPQQEKNGTAHAYQAQCSADEGFAAIAAESGWIEDTETTFENLASGTRLHFRVRARGESGGLSAWSPVLSSTPDDAGPTVAVAIPDTFRTSLLFNLVLSAEDDLSGLDQLELWYRVDDGDLVNHGPVAPGSLAFLAQGQGRHEFFLAATDVAGNRVEPVGSALAVYDAPEPIIIVDGRGEEFDITNAVLRHGIHVMFWDHGIGRFTIPPVIDPLMIGPGHRNYPSENNLDQICAVTFDGDNRAYRLSDLNNREVVNDTAAGVPIAACF